MAKVAINGLGRIGLATLKIVMDTPGLDMAAANDIGASDSLVYLLKYDTVHGRYEKTVEAIDDGHLTIGTHRVTLLRGENPARLPWKSLDVDIVFECTGSPGEGTSTLNRIGRKDSVMRARVWVRLSSPRTID
jgi:glyceraldehyde 3-phosphate dehydrogenase